MATKERRGLQLSAGVDVRNQSRTGQRDAWASTGSAAPAILRRPGMEWMHHSAVGGQWVYFWLTIHQAALNRLNRKQKLLANIAVLPPLIFFFFWLVSLSRSQGGYFAQEYLGDALKVSWHFTLTKNPPLLTVWASPHPFSDKGINPLSSLDSPSIFWWPIHARKPRSFPTEGHSVAQSDPYEVP